VAADPPQGPTGGRAFFAAASLPAQATFRAVCRELSAMRSDPHAVRSGPDPRKAPIGREFTTDRGRRHDIWNGARAIPMIDMSDPPTTPHPRTADPSISHETENSR